MNWYIVTGCSCSSALVLGVDSSLFMRDAPPPVVKIDRFVEAWSNVGIYMSVYKAVCRTWTLFRNEAGGRRPDLNTCLIRGRPGLIGFLPSTNRFCDELVSYDKRTRKLAMETKRLGRTKQTNGRTKPNGPNRGNASPFIIRYRYT
jgi:hypothetical protein